MIASQRQGFGASQFCNSHQSYLYKAVQRFCHGHLIPHGVEYALFALLSVSFKLRYSHSAEAIHSTTNTQWEIYYFLEYFLYSIAASSSKMLILSKFVAISFKSPEAVANCSLVILLIWALLSSSASVAIKS